MLLLKFYYNLINQIINKTILTQLSFKTTPLYNVMLNKISLLKSPHVNKKAWTQYKQTLYIKQIKVNFIKTNLNLYLSFFKNLINTIPNNINFKITNF